MKKLLAIAESVLILCFLALLLLIYARICLLDVGVTVRQEQILLKLDRIERTLNNANP